MQGFRGVVIKYRGGIKVFPIFKRRQMTPYEDLVGKIMKKGLKRKAKNILKFVIKNLYRLRIIKDRKVKSFNKFWLKFVIKRLSPMYDLNSRVLGMHTIYTPKPIYANRSKFYCYKWFFASVLKQKGETYAIKFFKEVVSLYRGVRTHAVREYLSWHRKGLADLALMGKARLPGAKRIVKKRKKRKGFSRSLGFLASSFYKGMGFIRRDRFFKRRKRKKMRFVPYERIQKQQISYGKKRFLQRTVKQTITSDTGIKREVVRAQKERREFLPSEGKVKLVHEKKQIRNSFLATQAYYERFKPIYARKVNYRGNYNNYYNYSYKNRYYNRYNPRYSKDYKR